MVTALIAIFCPTFFLPFAGELTPSKRVPFGCDASSLTGLFDEDADNSCLAMLSNGKDILEQYTVGVTRSDGVSSPKSGFVKCSSGCCHESRHRFDLSSILSARIVRAGRADAGTFRGNKTIYPWLVTGKNENGKDAENQH